MAEKKSTAESSKDFIDQIRAVAAALDCKFTLKGEPIDIPSVFTRTGLLPAIMRRADQLCSFCLGYSLGVTFERADGAILGVTVELDDKVSTSLRLLCAMDVLIEIMQRAPSSDVTPLDSLMLD